MVTFILCVRASDKINNPTQTPDMSGLNLSNGNRNETRLQTVIRLLTLLAGVEEPVSSDETWPLSDIAVMEELETGGYISAGEFARNDQGQVARMVGMRINPRGQAYLAGLQKQAAATSAGFMKGHCFSFLKWFFGIVGTVIAGLILWFITHH